ncbi:hypothetical protein [Streptomyces jumonjinensis]|uniref:hypothetical protein n=1 Tax=Streptomyces jumonjinensis TaxID=1945 RepID=UPI0037A7A096
MSSRTDATTWNSGALDQILSNGEGRPVLFANARVLTMDPLIGTVTAADLLFVGPLVVGVRPGIITAAADDNAIVVDCTGLTITPLSWTPWHWPQAVAGVPSTSRPWHRGTPPTSWCCPTNSPPTYRARWPCS